MLTTSPESLRLSGIAGLSYTHFKSTFANILDQVERAPWPDLPPTTAIGSPGQGTIEQNNGDNTLDEALQQPVGNYPEGMLPEHRIMDDETSQSEPEKQKAEEEADSLQHRVVEDETSAASEVDPQPVSWKPHGEAANLTRVCKFAFYGH